MPEIKFQFLKRRGETVADIGFSKPGTPEADYGYGVAAVKGGQRSTAGNSVMLDIKPDGAVEPVLITGDIELQLTTLKGFGKLVVYNVQEDNGVKVVPLDECMLEPVYLHKGDAYYSINTGTNNLLLRDDCTPAFEGHEEVSLVAAPSLAGAIDGRTVELPLAFWSEFALRPIED